MDPGYPSDLHNIRRLTLTQEDQWFAQAILGRKTQSLHTNLFLYEALKRLKLINVRLNSLELMI